jgi:hypothetical protein
MYVTYSIMFPLGCSVALLKKDIQGLLSAKKRTIVGIWAISSPFIYVAIAILFRGLHSSMTSSLWHFIIRQSSFVFYIILLLWALSALYRVNAHSMMLSSFGAVSYELFLIHGIFLIKYDFLLHRKPFVIYFIVFLLFILALSVMVKKYLSGRRFASPWTHTT